jgi:hypothetical protein
VNSSAMKSGFWKRHRTLKWTLGAAATVLAVSTAMILVLAHRVEPVLRAGIIQALEDHFHSHVELDSFHIELRDGLWAEGKGLRIWPPIESTGETIPLGQERPAIGKPLIQLREFRFHAPLEYSSGKPFRITVVRLKGLFIDIPPRIERKKGPLSTMAAKNRETDKAGENAMPQSSPVAQKLLSFKIDTLDCTDARLTLETNKPGKLPMEFDIARLWLTGIQPDLPVAFQAELTNPRPKGVIHSHGNIGPWNVSDAGETPVNGDYSFEHADLSIFKGIAGILSSEGHYAGTLRNLTVDGGTSTPDFRLDQFGTALPLFTRFHALVDGTNGDTQLDPVDAFLEQSHFLVRGQVVRATSMQDGRLSSHGHNIRLAMIVDRGHIEDFTRLMSHSGTPMLTGVMTMKGNLQIPPGTDAAQDRLKLSGTFSLSNVRFTSAKVQDRVSELSLRGQGNPGEVHSIDSSTVRSTMKGDFRMENGVVTLPMLMYTVPGAVINLKGSYSIDGGALDFVGTARMDATVSKMVGGWKGFLLKPADRFFKKDGAGTQVPIHIRGTRDEPQFGVDLGGAKSGSPQRPVERH